MEQGWTQHPKGHNRHPQRGQRSLHALASGPSYQGSSRRRWCHPDSYSSDGKEHFGSGRQKACPTANSTRSRETRTTSHRDELRWELQPHLANLIGTLSTGGGCYAMRLAIDHILHCRSRHYNVTDGSSRLPGKINIVVASAWFIKQGDFQKRRLVARILPRVKECGVIRT